MRKSEEQKEWRPRKGLCNYEQNYMLEIASDFLSQLQSLYINYYSRSLVAIEQASKK